MSTQTTEFGVYGPNSERCEICDNLVHDHWRGRPCTGYPIPKSEDGDYMTMEDFVQCVKSGLFTADDGSAYYASETEIYRGSYVDLENILTKHSHVVWFNK